MKVYRYESFEKIVNADLPANLLLKVFDTLRTRLNGQCGSHCPNSIYYELTGGRYVRGLFCGVCEKEFHFLFHHEKYNCPCYREINPDELFLRLDEYIDELREIVLQEEE